MDLAAQESKAKEAFADGWAAGYAKGYAAGRVAAYLNMYIFADKERRKAVNELDDDESKNVFCCAACIWRDEFTGVCCNGDSEHAASVVEEDCRCFQFSQVLTKEDVTGQQKNKKK